MGLRGYGVRVSDFGFRVSGVGLNDLLRCKLFRLTRVADEVVPSELCVAGLSGLGLGLGFGVWGLRSVFEVWGLGFGV